METSRPTTIRPRWLVLSETCSEPSALVDRSFRVELGRDIGSTDQMRVEALVDELVEERAHRLLTRAHHDCVDR